jgi:hypothetical protein
MVLGLSRPNDATAGDLDTWLRDQLWQITIEAGPFAFNDTCWLILSS